MCRFSTEDDATKCVLSVLRSHKQNIADLFKKCSFSEEDFTNCGLQVADNQLLGEFQLKVDFFQKCTRLKCDEPGYIDQEPTSKKAGPDGIVLCNGDMRALVEVKVYHADRAYEIFNAVAQLKEYLLTYSLKNGILLVVDPRLTPSDRQGPLFVSEFCALVNELLSSMLGISLTVLWVFRTENYVVKYCVWPNIQEVIVL